MIEFHGQAVSEVRHKPIAAPLASGTFVYRNLSGQRQWIQRFTVSFTGTVSIYIKVNGSYWSAVQQGTPTGVGDTPVAIPMIDKVDFAAFNENQEIELETNATVEVEIASGTGTIQLAILLAEGVR